MKKADVTLAGILVLTVLLLGAGAYLMPEKEKHEECSHEGHNHPEHVHSEHNHADHVHTDSCSHKGDSHASDTHEGHNHQEEFHEGHNHEHDVGTEIALSAIAVKNISLDTPDGVMTAEIGTFTRTHSIPAIVMEFEGRTKFKVPAPYAGIVTRVYHEPGVSVKPGEALFDVTLSLPEMRDAQITFLKLLETEAFLVREIAEIDKNLEGMAPQRRRDLDIRLKETRIELENQKETLTALGLPAEMLKQLATEKKRIEYVMTVPVPKVSHQGIVSKQNPGETKNFVVIEGFYVKTGDKIELGETLCDVCDLCELTVRGDAFAINEGILLKALKNPKTLVRVTFEGNPEKTLENLSLRLVESRIDEENRTLSCYADFKNVVLGEPQSQLLEKATQREVGAKLPDTVSASPRREDFTVHWLYKPGQRCQMEIGYETVENVFVVPVGAVARDVQDTYVFELAEEVENGEKIWRQVPVHLLFKTREKAVLATDGELKPGMKIAARSATFIQDAIKAQKSGGVVIDPHAGHNH
ncbi:MAG: efflux RND transporter periplasmic adaptor subunit [Planctomycetia bacterium]|nr:efflux RND transporter periplasmic adaptor subunit [Planctomycetia bacterium]